jgi:TolB-like protein
VPARAVAAAAAAVLAATSFARAAEPGAPPKRKVRVAVMEIRALGTETHMTDLLSEVALTEASSIARVEVIGRSDIESLLGFEKQKKMLGCTEESSCLAEIGGALGVDYVLVGSIGRLGKLLRVDMKLVDSQRGRVRGRTGESVEGREEQLVASVQRAVHRLLDPLVPDLATSAIAPSPVPAVARVPTSPADAAPGAAGSSRRTWGWTLAGSGLALVAGGAAFGALASSAYTDEKAAAAAGDLARYESLRTQVKSRALTADVLYGLGAVSLGTGAYLLFTSPRAPRPIAFTVTPTPSGAVAVVAGEF